MKKYSDRSLTVSFLLIFIIISMLFILSINLRSEWFGNISVENHQWLTASTINFTRNWLEENPFKIYFLQLKNPPSVEFSTLADRAAYQSYPVGSLLPVYLLGLLNAGTISAKVVMVVNLATQYLISLILTCTLFCVLTQAGIHNNYACLSALFSGITYIFLPGNLYWHQNVYYADQAVMLPFVLYICLEIILKYTDINPSTAKALKALQFITAFYGASCDYLFYCVGIVILFKRLIFKEFGTKRKDFLKNFLHFALPFFLALAFFAFQIIISDGWESLYAKFTYRTGLSQSGEKAIGNFLNAFWFGHMKKFYGPASTYIIFASIALLVITALIAAFKKKTDKQTSRKVNMLFEFTSLILLPCLLQITLLKNHSAVHSFSTLKLSLTLATIPFLLLPCLFCVIAGNGKAKFKSTSLVITLALILNTFYITSVYPIHENLFSESDDYSAELFLKHHTSFEDIVFSSNYQIAIEPPHQLAYSEKRVYQVDSIEQVAEKVKDIETDYSINVFVDTRWNTDESANDIILQPLIEKADNTITQDSYVLYEISKESYLDYSQP